MMVSSSTFRSNFTYDGGAVFGRASSTVTISDSIFEDNAATYGGGVFAARSALPISNSTFQSNTAQWGGTIFGSTEPIIMISDSACQSNSAEEAGGGQYVDGWVLARYYPSQAFKAIVHRTAARSLLTMQVPLCEIRIFKATSAMMKAPRQAVGFVFTREPPPSQSRPFYTDRHLVLAAQSVSCKPI